ncbi:heavy-metal-associated protein [Methanosarcina acetivorans C2A]|uniref:Heavy-metal-associated protein n=2 Tax=Methanosarcina acetivorans TaxID=2214 RepID=Q8TR48_METAC|nr:heavy-metal-associated protein [Methanosarcina acetivorans C2A]
MQGVQKVDVSLENKQAVVEFDEGKTNVENVKVAVKETGYEPPLKTGFCFFQFLLFYSLRLNERATFPCLSGLGTQRIMQKTGHISVQSCSSP